MVHQWNSLEFSIATASNALLEIEKSLKKWIWQGLPMHFLIGLYVLFCCLPIPLSLHFHSGCFWDVIQSIWAVVHVIGPSQSNAASEWSLGTVGNFVGTLNTKQTQLPKGVDHMSDICLSFQIGFLFHHIHHNRANFPTGENFLLLHLPLPSTCSLVTVLLPIASYKPHWSNWLYCFS